MLESLVGENVACYGIYLFEYFTLPGHSGFLHDVSITLIDKTDPSCPTKREDYWINTLKTEAPMRLNFDSDNSFRAYCFIFLHFCNWIWAAVFQALGYWISGVFMFLSFLTGFIY